MSCFVRYVTSSEEARQFELRLLPQDDETLLDLEDLRPIYRRTKQTDPDARHWLQSLLATGIAQYEASRSVDQVNAVFSASMGPVPARAGPALPDAPLCRLADTDAGVHRDGGRHRAGVERSGSGVREHRPGRQLRPAGARPDGESDRHARRAFHTTLLALLQAAALMLVMHLVQGQEEGALNRAGQYCLKNFINRLHRQGS